MNQKEAPIIVGLDIGTTKIAVIAGRKNEHGKLEILGFGRANSNGVEHGRVLNIDQTIKAIQQALKSCFESNPQLEITEVYVGIAGQHIKSLQTRGDIVRHDPESEIQQSEVDILIENQRKTFIPAGDQIIDVIPQEFYVDNIQNIKQPVVGYNGVKVGANFHIITGDKNAIKNINRAVVKSGLTIKDLVLQPLASASAVMSDIDLEAGVAILDIGGGTSDLAVFNENILRHTAVIPIGGENITNDIRQGLGVLKQQAEAMKVQFGSALADEAKANAYITIPGLKGMPAKEISVKNLAKIIQARMEDIFDFVTYHLKQVGLDGKQLNGGVILTGGGSQLKHLIQLTEYATGLNARVGLPIEHLAPNHIEELKKPMYATCIGLILKGYNDYEHKYKEFAENYLKIEVPDSLKTEGAQEQVQENSTNTEATVDVEQRKNKLSFWDKIGEKLKRNIYEIFSDQNDKAM
ncbi:MAG: cell division protein FtsA [Chitinophagales bacterium]|nr:cell division protein FtsA [Chitinophagales bacterium]